MRELRSPKPSSSAVGPLSPVPPPPGSPWRPPTSIPAASVEDSNTPPMHAASPKRWPLSPNSQRVVKRTVFPREELWSWAKGTGANAMMNLSPGQAQCHDAIESILRESAITAPPPMGPPLAAIPHATRHLPLHHQQQPHGHHPPPLHASSAAAPPLSTSSPSPTPPTTSSSLHFGASRRKLAKKETHASLRASTRNLPAATGGDKGKEVDGWKAYKLAHRTNRLIAKTRKALEVLAAEKDAGVLGDHHDGEKNGQPGGHVELETPLEDEEPASSRRGSPTQAEEPLTLAQMFQRDVCTDDETDGKASDFRQPALASTYRGTVDADDQGHIGDEKEFWQIYKSAGSNPRPDSARGRYIGQCEDRSLLVLPVLDLKRPRRYNDETKALKYDNYFFGDERAEAFGDALHLLPVQIKNLSMKNIGVTGVGSSAIVDGIAMTQLQHLTLSENRVGHKGAIAILKGLEDPHVNLKTLDLGNNQLGDQAVRMLMQSLVNRCTLEHLDLRKNNIYLSAKAVGELLRISTPLKSLNLSWNNIRGEPAQYLAKCMMENITLISLDLSDNTLGNNGSADVDLAMCLATNKSLRYLNVSNNHVHGKSALVFASGLQQNTVLETLVIRGNPIGCLGTEALLRSVASGMIIKCEIDIGDCNVEIQESTQQTVIYGGGSYTLNLSDRSDIILLKELLQLCWKNKAEIVEATLNGSPYNFNRRDERTFIHGFPPAGLMQIKIQPNYDRREDMIADHGLQRVVRLLKGSFGECKDRDESAKLFCIRLLAEEYSFRVDQANTLLTMFQSHTSQVEKASAAAVLIPQILSTKDGIIGREEVFDCKSMEVPVEFFEDRDKDGKIDVCGDICMVIGLQNLSDVEQAHVEKRVGKWISFNVNNPTGHYRLNMSNQIDRRILMRILEANRLEKKLRQHFRLMDTSQHGISAQPLQGGFRNVKLNHVSVTMGTTWQFPRMGILEFDFVQTRRPYSICTALSDAAFEKFLREFKNLNVDADIKLIGLRSISTSYYFDCSQVQRLMEQFGTFERHSETGALFRAEVFIILFTRIVDEWNMSECLALLDLATKQQVFERLGHLNCFHPLQLTENYEQLQMSMFDHRQFLLVLVKLACSGEMELSNVILNNETSVPPEEWTTWTSEDKLLGLGAVSCSMRAIHGMQSESQLASASARKKLIQGVLLKLENRSQELIS